MDEAAKREIRNQTEQLLKFLPKAVDAVQQYRLMEYRTPQEEKAYRELISVLRDGLMVLKKAYEFLGAELYGNALAYYYSIKVKAKRGDEKAKAIFNDLAPDFEYLLMHQVDKN